MPKTNTRAIAKLLEAHKVLKKQGRGNNDTSAGQAFALDLVRHLETGKPGVLKMGDEYVYPFKPADVRVSRTRVSIGKCENLCLGMLQSDEDGGYAVNMLVDEVNLLGETMPLRIEQATP